jgi:hypothetical protein
MCQEEQGRQAARQSPDEGLSEDKRGEEKHFRRDAAKYIYKAQLCINLP